MLRTQRLIAVIFLCYFFTALGLPGGPVSAASVDQEQRASLRLEDTIREELSMRQPATVTLAVADDSLIKFSSIKVHGASLLGSVELEASVEKFVDVPMTYEQLFEVAMAVESYYRQHNYLARVVLPTQDISGGVLDLEVIESVITLTEVDAKLEEMPDTRAQMDALIGTQEGQESAISSQLESDADVALLLGIYQTRTQSPRTTFASEYASSNMITDLVAFVSNLREISDKPDDLVMTKGDMTMNGSSTQKIPIAHDPLTRRRRFISYQMSTQHIDAA